MTTTLTFFVRAYFYNTNLLFPSGDPEPSREDITVTQRISEAGRVMEIPVLDHIIIGDGTFVSLCERGYI
jgi:DNA repair protein RadC